jgi:hypothetical protein
VEGILSGFTHYPHHLILNSVVDPKVGRGGYSFWIHTLSPPPDFELSDSGIILHHEARGISTPMRVGN